MQNIENSETKKLSKQEYNRLYYQNNKKRWNSKAKDHFLSNVFPLFGSAQLSVLSISIPIRKWISYLKWVELLVLFVLVGVITTFLIREAASFYLDEQDGNLVAYLKAALLEGTAVLFTLSQSKHTLLKWAQRFVTVLLCSFTLWVMSGKLIKSAVGDSTKIQLVHENLKQLESELAQKEDLRAKYLKIGKLTLARRYEKGLEPIRSQLISIRHDLSIMQSPRVIANGLGILIAFRLLLVIANLICVHRISEEFGRMWGRNIDLRIERRT